MEDLPGIYSRIRNYGRRITPNLNPAARSFPKSLQNRLPQVSDMAGPESAVLTFPQSEGFGMRQRIHQSSFGQKSPDRELFHPVSLTDASEGHTRDMISVWPYQCLQSFETMMAVNLLGSDLKSAHQLPLFEAWKSDEAAMQSLLTSVLMEQPQVGPVNRSYLLFCSRLSLR